MTEASGCEPVTVKAGGAGGESARALTAALAAGELEQAERLALELRSPVSLDVPARKALADLHMKGQRWAAAAEILASIQPRSVGVEMQWRLARNLAELQQHRREAYRVLTTAARPDSPCQPIITCSGSLSIVQTPPGAQPTMLTPGGDPAAATRQIIEGLANDHERGRCLALCGVGDGYLLTDLAAHPPRLQLGQQQCIHLIEPHIDVLLAGMMIHDWSGPTGPIQDRRFQWWIGSAWMSDLHEALMRDPYLPLPERTVRMSINSDELDSNLREIVSAEQENERRMAARVARRYANLKADQLARLFGGNPPRTPRVLLLTTRFSTVLQHSTRDLAAAFEKAGWAMRMPIEPGAHHRNSQRNMLRHLVDFQPDLIVQIDHLRSEHGNLFPPQVPFVCWIQDDLPNLMKREAGEAIGARDYVLTTTQAVYQHDFGYPARQCVYMPKSTRLPEPADIALSQSPDVVYVSNASATAEALIDRLVAECASEPRLAQFISEVAEALSSRYAHGGSVFTVSEIQRLLEVRAARCGARLAQSGLMASKLAARLFATVNNALYRQQAIEWVVRACQRLGLSLGLYGVGWEQHPTLAEYARGTVQYGPELESLTRCAKINLQIVPYMFLHQRWLDGIAAGGFFLIRQHPMDALAADMAAFIDANLDESVNTLEQACVVLRGEKRAELDSLVARRLAYDDHRGTDPIALYRLHRIEGRDYIYQSPAHLREVSFADESSLSNLLEQFAGDTKRRAAVLQRQREYVAAHFTYSAGLRRVLARIHDLLIAEAMETDCDTRQAEESVAKCV